MEKTRYFRSANRFNAALNFWSGNDFPLSDESEILSWPALLWVSFAGSVKIFYVVTGAMGTLYFANYTVGEMFTAAGSMSALMIELGIPAIYFNLKRKELRDLIKKYNDVLIDSELMKKLMEDIFKPYKIGFIIYILTGLSATFVWAAVPVLHVFEKDRFTYADYTVPVYFPGEPFNIYLFLSLLLVTVISACFIELAKIAVDLYVCYFVTVLVAQYKYIRAQLLEALRQENGERDEGSVIKDLQKCVEHHCAVIEAGRILGDIMALHVGATYLAVIVKFCFLAFGLATLGDVIIRKITYTLFSVGCLAQVYVLCSAIQELLDSSTSVTEDAFHENWHARSYAVKKFFCIIELSSQMECRLSAYRIVELVVPTMALILSKSYSLCLLLLTVN